MQYHDIFNDYDDEEVFHSVQRDALNRNSRNFVLEFGRDEAQIAFDLEPLAFKGLLDEQTRQRELQYPVRWM